MRLYNCEYVYSLNGFSWQCWCHLCFNAQHCSSVFFRLSRSFVIVVGREWCWCDWLVWLVSGTWNKWDLVELHYFGCGMRAMYMLILHTQSVWWKPDNEPWWDLLMVQLLFCCFWMRGKAIDWNFWTFVTWKGHSRPSRPIVCWFWLTSFCISLTMTDNLCLTGKLVTMSPRRSNQQSRKKKRKLNRKQDHFEPFYLRYTVNDLQQ